MPPVCHRKAFYSDDFTFSYFDTELQESKKNQGFPLLRWTFLDWDLHHQPVLLSASCGFDSRWERSNGHEPCKKRDNTDCASLLANNSYYLFFYRATPAMKKVKLFLVFITY